MTVALSVVIPAYQEARNIEELLPLLLSVLESMNITFEILIVDTPEPMDDTQSVCESFAVPNLRYLRRDEGFSFGSAVRSGIKHARGTFVIFMDGDGSHHPEFLRTLYESRELADVVVASRYIKGGNTDNSLVLKLMSLLVNFVYRIVFSLDCMDVSNSFKLYRLEMLRKIRLVSENFDIIEEILIKLRRSYPKLTIKELPFYFRNRKHGKTKRNLFVFAFSFMATIIRLVVLK
ncbi:MAG: glycosyltransferase [Magnetococcales bacterium]|nr:glycosyltransferase [Magnetococcales bacterium]MBF0151901.1 glycosyltransferase [Magnetococcales bacterium]MBF0632188.1 glycosyltransferase [Magnetococcales bacterium]